MIIVLNNKFDAALAKLDALMQKKKELQEKELMEVIEHSDKSKDEILAYVTEKDSG